MFNNLEELFKNKLKETYGAEKLLIEAIPLLIANATAELLIKTLADHLEVTINQVARLESIFVMMEMELEAHQCLGMEALIKEGDTIIQNTLSGSVRDMGITSVSQKIEHYEIATYGTLISLAETLRQNEVAGLLNETLREEKEANSNLTGVGATVYVKIY